MNSALKKRIRLSEWAKLNSYTQKGAYLLWRSGKFPYPTVQLPSGMVLIEVNDIDIAKPLVIYSRVSSSDQSEDLERQSSRLREFANSNGMIVSEVVKEIGSGLNGKRQKFLKLLRTDCDILVEYPDRLTRFGFEYIQEALLFSGRRIIVANKDENNLDLVKDFIDVVTSMFARIYGKRSARNKANKLVKDLHENNKK